MSSATFATSDEMSSAQDVNTAAKLGDIPFKPSKEIPTSFKASFSSWWSTSAKESAVAEERLFRRMPFFVPSVTSARTSPTASSTDVSGQAISSEGLTASVSLVELNSPKQFLNTLSILPTGANAAAASLSSPTTSSSSASSSQYVPTVILPGYGAGIGFFYLNLPYLGANWVKKRNAPVYAVDWLGMGRSARPNFPNIKRTLPTTQRVEQAESFFLDALEEWRIKQGIEKMALVGHSLGAYLSVAYALRFPERVDRLVLLSPAGVPRDPNGMVPSEEVAPHAETSASAGANANGAGTHEPSKEELKERKEALRVAKKNESTFRKFATWAWEQGWSPFQIVRSMVFWGPWMVGKYSSRRFPTLPVEDTRDLHEYIWHIVSAKGSGEYCVSHLLAPGAIARRPLVDRIAALQMPITFAYGDNDWMSVDGGSESVQRLKEAGNKDAHVYVIKNAGHHLYLDNPTAVNELIVKALKRGKRSERESAGAGEGIEA